MNDEIATRKLEGVEAFEAHRANAEKLSGGPVELVAAAPVLYQGWEHDQWMWLVKSGDASTALGDASTQVVASE